MSTLFAAEVFSYAGMIAMTGWVALAIGVAFRIRLVRDVVCGVAFPTALSVLYTSIVAIHWWDTPGGFDSLQSVSVLFQSDWLLLAGWTHYLAYDLFIGAWIAKQADLAQVPRVVTIAILPLCFLFGPAGFLLWQMTRAVWPTTKRLGFSIPSEVSA